MCDDSVLNHFELLYTGKADDRVPVFKYRSLESGVQIVFSQAKCTDISAVFCLATEAHDDDGLPEAVQRMICMGSEEYPYKDIIDILAKRYFGLAKYGCTRTDHTYFEFTTAGTEGFLQLLLVYLDHILFPAFKESAYITQVHHINGEGEDGGKMYYHVQMFENYAETSVSPLLAEMMREMYPHIHIVYPGHYGYTSVTGAVMKNIRENTSLEKAKSYHREFYRPENLCIIVVGMVETLDVLKTFLKFEEKILSRPVDRPVYVRPWQSDVPPLFATVERTVKFPGGEEVRGYFGISWRGPCIKDTVEMIGMKMLLIYLTMCTSSPLKKEYVLSENPYCREISYSISENSVSCVFLNFHCVFVEKLQDIKTSRVLELLQSISDNEDLIDMNEMQTLLNQELLHILDHMDNFPQFILIFSLMTDFLYSNTKEDTDLRLNKESTLRDLIRKPASFWSGLIKKYFVDKHYVAFIGEPSVDLMMEIEETEKKRVEEQKERLKPEELAEKQKLLDLAFEEIEIQPPAELLDLFPVPTVYPVELPSITSACNYGGDSSLELLKKFLVDEIPVSFQLDDVESNTVMFRVLMDSSEISEELRHYLVLYTEAILQSSILRNGVLISAEDVQKEHALDTDLGICSIGISKYEFLVERFSCESPSTCVVLKIRAESQKYMKAVQWLHELLYEVQFDVECVKSAVSRLTEHIEFEKNSCIRVAGILIAQMLKKKGSNEYIANMLRQQKFLTEMVGKLEADPSYSTVVLEKLNELKVELTDPARLRVHMSAHVDRLVTQTGLSDAVSVWSNVFLPSAQQKYRVKSSPPKDFEFQKPYTTVSEDSGNLIDNSLSLIIGVEQLYSSCLYLTTPCLTEYGHADVPAIMVYIEYLTQSEGPMWKQIFEQELGRPVKLTLKLDCGCLELCLEYSPNVVEAYRVVMKIIEGFSEDGAEFDRLLVEWSKSAVAFNSEYIRGDISKQSLMERLQIIPPGYNRWLLDKIPEVSSDDLRRVSKLYFTSLFSPTQSKLAMCTKPEDMNEICQKFKEEFGRELAVVKSLEEPYLVDM